MCFPSTLARSVLCKGFLAPLVGLCLVGQAIAREEEVRDAAGVATAKGSTPDAKVATVLGRDISEKDLTPPPEWFERRAKHIEKHGETMGLVSLEEYRMNKLYQLIWQPLSFKYIPKKEVEPTEAELQTFIAHYRPARAHMRQKQQDHVKELQKEADLLRGQAPSADPDKEKQRAARLQEIQRYIEAHEISLKTSLETAGGKNVEEQLFAVWYLGNWKRQQWFYRRYGGRVIAQQVGPQAVDAMRDFLKEAEAKGDFAIYDEDLKKKFWEPYTRERPGTVLPDPDKIFAHPWSTLDLPKVDFGAISGTVVDAQSKGVENVVVSVYRAGDDKKPLATATTTPEGKFKIDSVPAGNKLVVKAKKRNSLLGVCGEKQDVSVHGGKTTDVGNIELKVPTRSR
jgi:hypothetical protein